VQPWLPQRAISRASMAEVGTHVAGGVPVDDEAAR